jgi:hypothetical protein
MDKKKPKVAISHFELCVILAFIVTFFFAIHPVVGAFVAIFIALFYKHLCRKFLPQETHFGKYSVNPETKKLLDAIIAPQTSPTNQTFDAFSHPITKGSLPAHIHKILDEMGITTWTQLALFDEKELLYKKCFGEEALKKIKAELAQRGLTLNGPQNQN